MTACLAFRNCERTLVNLFAVALANPDHCSRFFEQVQGELNVFNRVLVSLPEQPPLRDSIDGFRCVRPRRQVAFYGFCCRSDLSACMCSHIISPDVTGTPLREPILRFCVLELCAFPYRNMCAMFSETCKSLNLREIFLSWKGREQDVGVFAPGANPGAPVAAGKSPPRRMGARQPAGLLLTRSRQQAWHVRVVRARGAAFPAGENRNYTVIAEIFSARRFQEKAERDAAGRRVPGLRTARESSFRARCRIS